LFGRNVQGFFIRGRHGFAPLHMPVPRRHARIAPRAGAVAGTEWNLQVGTIVPESIAPAQGKRTAVRPVGSSAPFSGLGRPPGPGSEAPETYLASGAIPSRRSVLLSRSPW